MSTIDPETGLPRLPEDYFWRVSKAIIQIRKRFVTDWCYPERDNYDLDGPGIEWHTETRTVITGHTHGFFTESKPIYGTEIRRIGSYTIKVEPVSALTHASLVKACSSIADEFEAEQERAKLYGDYPPKRLETA